MMVKICGITNRDDAQAAVVSGADALGFNFYRRSPRYIDPEKAADIASLIPRKVLKVGVFVNEEAERIRSITWRAKMDIAQLHGTCGMPEGIRVWKALTVGPDFDREEFDRWPVEAFVLDTPAGNSYGGTGRTFDWRLVAGLCSKIILAGGLDADNVAQAICIARPWGVDSCSRLESAPGKKDHDKIARFVSAALSAETR